MSRWDCENRLIQITYPGMNNKTEMTYGPTGGRVKIVETVSGSVTSTKQFIGGEERDGSGNVTKQFFSEGQISATTNYFYSFDHLGSVRTLTDDSGVVQSDCSFDPFGRTTKLQGSQDSDFGYGSMYIHARSGLHFTRFRAYSPVLGIWLSTDPVAAKQSYDFVAGDPINLTDPLGLAPTPRQIVCPCGRIVELTAAAVAHITQRHGPGQEPQGPNVEPRGNFTNESWLPQIIDRIIQEAVCGTRVTHQANGRDAYRVSGRVWTRVDGVPVPEPPPRAPGVVFPPGGYGPPAPTDTVVVVVDPTTNTIITAYPE